MKKMYFSLEKYQKNLSDNGIEKGVIELMSKSDKIYDEQEVIFLHKGDSWGVVDGKKDIIHRAWCVDKIEGENFFTRLFKKREKIYEL
jgi:hypothetical protein